MKYKDFIYQVSNFTVQHFPKLQPVTVPNVFIAEHLSSTAFKGQRLFLRVYNFVLPNYSIAVCYVLFPCRLSFGWKKNVCEKENQMVITLRLPSILYLLT